MSQLGRRRRGPPITFLVGARSTCTTSRPEFCVPLSSQWLLVTPYPATPPTITCVSSRHRLERSQRSSSARSIPVLDHISFQWGASLVNQIGNEIDVTSGFAILDPPPCPHIPDPYQVSADLGALPDGQYVAVWTVGPLVVHQVLIVFAGQLLMVATPVPTMNLPELFTLLGLVGGIGVAFLRRRRHWGEPSAS